MNYYPCPIGELRLELQRRGLAANGTHDELSEVLEKDDKDRGAETTTITTIELNPQEQRNLNLASDTAGFGQIAPAGLLVNERIVYWNMNTFFPSLQLFFESGLSCTISAGRRSDSIVCLDPILRFRLTDCTHEEDGGLVKTLRPDKFARSVVGITIKEATIANRISIAVKSRAQPGDAPSTHRGEAIIGQEEHTVVGLRLEGMAEMAYVYGRVKDSFLDQHRLWVDVRPTGLREDVPLPSLVSSQLKAESGARIPIVLKESQISVVKNTGPKE
ncbi:hypothetical protein BDU57DRAFT_583119 [Ampelomyces quisqualis]|uniref:SAP domain-containing protein n=1 Tax=Ampelomyces quisqualis TaxID=50730 RepID=A0A6A5QAK1_AMPQU|nr:hypothetical protein BDU57DRAFT_583119 [Ampelomyces quisqualis]